MVDWTMPASEAKAISDGNMRVRRVLGLISQMIFESAMAGSTYVFFKTDDSDHGLINSLNTDEIQTVLNVLYDKGYSYIPMYKENNRSDSKWHEDPGKRIARYKSGHTGTTLIGYNIDWSGQYDE